MINKIFVSQAGPLKEKELILKKYNLIIGLNESGKTTLTDIIIDYLYNNFIKQKNKQKKFSELENIIENKRFPLKYEINSNFIEKNFSIEILSLLFIRKGDSDLIYDKDSILNKYNYWNDIIFPLLNETKDQNNKLDKIKNYINTGADFWKQLNTNINNLLGFINNNKIKINNTISSVFKLNEKKKEFGEIISKIDTLNRVKKIKELKDKEKILDEISEIENKIEKLKDKNIEKKIKEYNDLKEKLEIQNKNLKEINEKIKELDNKKFNIEKEINNLMLEKKDLENKIELEKNKITLKKEKNESIEKELNELKKIKEDLSKNSSNILKFIVINLILLPLMIIGNIYFVMYRDIKYLIANVFIITLIAFLYIFFSKKRDISDNEMTIKLLEKEKYEIDLIINSISENITKINNDINKIIEKLRLKNKEIEDIERENLQYNNRKNEIELILKGYEINNISLTNITDELIRLNQELNNYKMLVEKKDELIRSSLAFFKEFFRVDSFNLTKFYILIKEEIKKYVDITDEQYKNFNDKLLTDENNKKIELEKEIINIKNEYEKIEKEICIEFNNILQRIIEIKNDFFIEYFKNEFERLKMNRLEDFYPIEEKLYSIIEDIKKYNKFCLIIEKKIDDYKSKKKKLIEDVLNSQDFIKNINKLYNKEVIQLRSSKPEKDLKKNKDDIVIELSYKDNNTYKFDNLSSGARQQLYFIIRLELLSKLNYRDGILILDDSFILYDKERREKGLKLLKEYCERYNHQFIYFSIDDGFFKNTFQTVFKDDLNIIQI